MELIYKITDEDVGESFIEMTNPSLRLAARGIVIRDDGKIAVFNLTKKNCYKLPGGGLEGDETPEEAFRREALEETGCEIEVIENLGATEEFRSLDNLKQISYAFVGKVLKDTKQLNVTEKEKAGGAMLIWETPENALKLIQKCHHEYLELKDDFAYGAKFMSFRDIKILEKFLENN